MQNIVGTRIHEEILGLIDRAEHGVVLVTPFLRVWPELRRALARAVARGVSLSLVTRGPKDAPRDEELGLFEDLQADIRFVPNLHLKAYLSDREAIHTSVNLTRESVGRSVESAWLFCHAEDRDGWNNVYETWQKTVDELSRDEMDGSIADRFAKLHVPLREQAEQGDEDALREHRYCIVCGSTASEDGDAVVCLRCHARAIAEDRQPEDLVATRCARCNGPWRNATTDRPYCVACYRAEQDAYARRPTYWYVLGATDALQAWAHLGKGSSRPHIPDAVAKALARRWSTLLARDGWLSVALTLVTPKPGVLLDCALPETGVDLGGLSGVVLERVPERTLPTCRDVPHLAPDHGLHLGYARSDAPCDPSRWTTEELLATWDVDLPTSVDGSSVSTPEWLWKVLLAPRRSFRPENTRDPSRLHLEIRMELTVPPDLRSKWRPAVGRLQALMLAALYTYDEAEVREWLVGADTRALNAIVRALVGPAPLGPAALVRDSKKKNIKDLPTCTDRVAALRVDLHEGEGWHLKGSVARARRAPVH